MNRKQRRAAAKQPQAALTPAFSQALALHQAGRLAEAEKIYGQILKVQPNHFDSLHLLGVIYSQRGNHVESVRQIDLALKLNPKAVYAHNNRGTALRELKRFDEALASYDKAIALKGRDPALLNCRGAVLREAREETGLTIEPGELLGVFERVIPDERGRLRYHYVLIDFLCRRVAGDLAAADDAEQARWFLREELGALELALETEEVIHKGFEKILGGLKM